MSLEMLLALVVGVLTFCFFIWVGNCIWDGTGSSGWTFLVYLLGIPTSLLVMSLVEDLLL